MIPHLSLSSSTNLSLFGTATSATICVDALMDYFCKGMLVTPL